MPKGKYKWSEEHKRKVKERMIILNRSESKRKAIKDISLYDFAVLLSIYGYKIEEYQLIEYCKNIYK